jgi:hypothetical protein
VAGPLEHVVDLVGHVPVPRGVRPGPLQPDVDAEQADVQPLAGEPLDLAGRVLLPPAVLLVDDLGEPVDAG